MPVRDFRFLAMVIAIADRLSSPDATGESFFPRSGPLPDRRQRREAAALRSRRVSPALPFGRPRNALNQSRAAHLQAAFPG